MSCYIYQLNSNNHNIGKNKTKNVSVYLLQIITFIMCWGYLLSIESIDTLNELNKLLAEENFNGTIPPPTGPDGIRFFRKVESILQKDPKLWSILKKINEELKRNGTTFEQADVDQLYKRILDECQPTGPTLSPFDRLFTT
ncbi:uncharacterized protein LOC142330378 [Lycorma delicatula]|uniref:uncharacterized protein LOC142330378 n=1 Tax=Lycorma delicatula TaxID=130591 RepID=UPI003F513E3B